MKATNTSAKSKSRSGPSPVNSAARCVSSSKTATGNAAATVTAQLHEEGGRTNVSVDTDLKIVGKLAQFGSGMLQQVSEKLLGQFVESLEAKLAKSNQPVNGAAAQGEPPAE